MPVSFLVLKGVVNLAYLELKGITKPFPGVVANQNVDLSVEGTVHALVGENGAGKTTLMRILYGLYTADGGDIFLEGKQVDIRTPQDAIQHGNWHGPSGVSTGALTDYHRDIGPGMEISKGPWVNLKAMRQRVMNFLSNTACMLTLTGRWQNCLWVCSSG